MILNNAENNAKLYIQSNYSQIKKCTKTACKQHKKGKTLKKYVNNYSLLWNEEISGALRIILFKDVIWLFFNTLLKGLSYSKNPHKRTKILRTSSLKFRNPFRVKMVLRSKYGPY